jgi:hypothetical protein
MNRANLSCHSNVLRRVLPDFFNVQIFKGNMNPHKFLADNFHSICAEWTAAIINTYPEEGAKFFSGGKNQFSNPVGHTFRNNIERMLTVLIREGAVEECSKDLDGILRIRAVQGFAPSVALCFLPALKEIIHREAVKSLPVEEMDATLHDLNVRIDRLTMLGFDLYMACREVLWQQKANQLYSRTHKLLEKANLLQDEEVAG